VLFRSEHLTDEDAGDGWVIGEDVLLKPRAAAEPAKGKRRFNVA
jgi:hypothetical protein